MSKNSVACQKKVDTAVWILQNTAGVKVLQAMILARFSKSEVTNKIVCRMIQGQHGSGGYKDTGGNSNDRGHRQHQQSTKSGGGNGGRNGNDDSNDKDDEIKGNGSSGGSLAAVQRWKQLGRNCIAAVGSTAAMLAVRRRQWQQRGGGGQLGLGSSVAAAASLALTAGRWQQLAWPWRQHGSSGGNSMVGSAVAAWQRRWRQRQLGGRMGVAVRQRQRQLGSGGCCHRCRAVAACCRSGNKDTGGNSNGGGTDNTQQSTKCGGGNGVGNSDDDSHNNNNEKKGVTAVAAVVVAAWQQRGNKGGGSAALAAVAAPRRQWQRSGVDSGSSARMTKTMAR
jgi:hypothetical protein